MSSNNDATESTSIFDDGDTVDLLQSLINDARSTDICEASLRKNKISIRSKIAN
jgi:hypothetical protein